MKVINNKKGSAMLWTILLTVILTILLGSIMTASYAYFNYTMYTVKRQQAYFTARSATNALIEEFSDQAQKAVTAPDGYTTYEDLDPEILPERNSSIEISDFGFPSEMGKATAKLERGNGDEVDISVTATYADQDYTIKSTVVRQPLYFAGIAVKNITAGSANSSLKLGDNTDLYWNNATTTFETTMNGCKVLLDKGNLVTKGDAKVLAGATVARHKFGSTVSFSRASGSRYIRKIWGPEEYIISNKTLKAGDSESTEYVSSVLNTLKNITNYTVKYCNNSRNRMPNHFGYFGFDDDSTLGKILSFLKLDKAYEDMRNQSMSLTKQTNNALNIQYIKLLSLSAEIDKRYDKLSNEGNIFQQLQADIYKRFFQKYVQSHGLTVFDVSYIEFNARDENTRDDDMIPLVYLFVDGGTNERNGIKVRIKYGKDPAKESVLYNGIEDINKWITGKLEDWFKIKNNMAYVIVYLEPNSSIELGCKVNGRNDNLQDLVFAYSIYGGDNTTVILNDKVTVLGEIYCDNLIVNGNANVTYTNSSGSQIAKQKVAEYWTIVNYSD